MVYRRDVEWRNNKMVEGAGQKIILLAKDRNLRQKLGRNARELVMKEHSGRKEERR